MVKFTQYMRPDGRRKAVAIDCDKSTERKAEEVIKAGYGFSVEVLVSGEVSFTCEECSDEDEVVAHEICPNGPQVPGAVVRLINTAYRSLPK